MRNSHSQQHSDDLEKGHNDCELIVDKAVVQIRGRSRSRGEDLNYLA